MDFLVKGNKLEFLDEELVLRNYIIFYFDETWDEYNERYVILGNSSIKNYKIKLTKNYIEIPSRFKDSKLLSVKLIGKNDLDKIETNNEIGRRA